MVNNTKKPLYGFLRIWGIFIYIIVKIMLNIDPSRLQ